MARELSIYGQRRVGLPAQLPVVQVSTAGVENLQRGSEFLGRTGAEIADRAAQNAYTKAQVVVTRETNRIAKEHASDPEALSSAMSEWADEFTGNIFDTEVREKIRLQIETSAVNAVAKATDRRNEILKQEQQYNGLLALDSIQKEIEDIAPDVASGRPDAARKLQEIMARGMATANEVGPDGAPLFTPDQRARRVLAVQDGAPLAIARAYVANSGDIVKSAGTWLRNGLTVTLKDDKGNDYTVNIRDAMSFEGREKADSQVMGLVRDQLAIQAAGRAAQERQAKALAEQAFVELSVRLQTDPSSVPVEALDANRQLFINGGKTTEFLALRKLATAQEAQVSIAEVRNSLFSMAQNAGNAEQANTVLQQAHEDFVAGRLTREDYKEAVSIAQRRTGESFSPRARAREQVLDAASEKGPMGNRITSQSSLQAERAFEQMYDRLEREYNGNVPQQQINGLVDDLILSYGIAQKQQADAMTQRPSFIDQTIARNYMQTRDEGVKRVIVAKSISHFSQKFGTNDETKWDANDPELTKYRLWLEGTEKAASNQLIPR